MGDDVSIIHMRLLHAAPMLIYTWDVANYLSQDPIS